MTVPGNSTGRQAVFDVWNATTSFKSVSFSCASTGPVTCTGVNPSSYVFDANEATFVRVTYSTSGSGSGTLSLVASGGASEQGWYSVSVIAPAPPIVSFAYPSGTGRVVVATRTPRFTATLNQNERPLSPSSVQMIWDRAGATPPDTIRLWTPVAPDSAGMPYGRLVTAADSSSMVVEWEVDSARGLNATSGGDSAQVSLKVCDNGVPGQCNTVTRWVVLPNDSTAVLAFNNVPLERLSPAFSSPFGPGVAVSGAEVETGIGTTPYFSMGAARSAGLVYSTRQSYPRVLVPVDVELRWPTSGSPSSMVFRLYDGAVKLDTFLLSNPTCATGSAKRCHAVLQGDFSASTFTVPTLKSLKVEVAVTSGAVTKSSSSNIEALIVDRRSTMYGSGWWPAGAVKLVWDATAKGRILVGANGAGTLFRGPSDEIYLPPPGSHSSLARTASGWELTSRGTKAKMLFDNLGRLQAAVDPNGNRDSISYVGSTDTVAALVDPVGKRISFSYTSGRLSTITSLPGEAGERSNRISIDATTNQLLYDSVSSPTSRPYTSRFGYQAYPGTKTSVLTRRIGVIADTTIIVYDSTFLRRPVQSKLPLVIDPATGSATKPTITYTAMESRGYHGLVRVDSAGPYVEMKDPRGHWTRTWLNRWGQVLVSWDTLGLLSRARYTAEGFVLWTEGRKTADTTRTRYTYNERGLLVRTWVKRAEKGGSVLRLDSLVYDGYDRVVRRIDARGKVDSVEYDANGNVIKSWDKAGNLTKVWYRSDGLVDSTQPPVGGVRRFKYDATWKQPLTTRLGPRSPGVLLDSTAYDVYGRAAVLGLRRVQLSADSTWQWRRTTPYFSIANQVDSSSLQLSKECTGACASPPTLWFGGEVTRVRFDRAGRDSVRTSPNEQATLYLYDRLGRLLSRKPPGTGARDSMVYDIAGNLVKTITRRGDTITTSFDSRNRDTATVVPGYGTIRKVFGGPLDQLTRITVANLVDSIGGVNPEVRYGYDARGRLLADTAYAGAQVLATTHTYDFYERDSISVDPRGTWKVRYDNTRGLPATLVTPNSDSLTYSFDGQGRLATRSVLSSGPQVYLLIDYSGGGEVQGLSTTVYSGGGAWTPIAYKTTNWLVDEGPPIGPLWTMQMGSGTVTDSLIDSVGTDARERMTDWRQLHKPGGSGAWSIAGTDTVSFDEEGNVEHSGSPAYANGTQQLQTRIEDGGTWSYSYDAAGNQTQAQWVKAGSGTRTWVYGYDPLNRLVSARFNGTLIARYGYDVLGRRIVKRVYSSATGGTVAYRRFAYAGDHISEVIDSMGKTRFWRYTWGNGADDLVGFQDENTQYYVARDKLGSIRAVWKRDGTWVLSQRFTPYGQLLARDSSMAVPAGLLFGWTGREPDAETGLYYFRARYYDPGQRRFTKEDPIGYTGGGNLYAYVGGAVLEARDPTGLDCGWYQSAISRNAQGQVYGETAPYYVPYPCSGPGGTHGGEYDPHPPTPGEVLEQMLGLAGHPVNCGFSTACPSEISEQRGPKADTTAKQICKQASRSSEFQSVADAVVGMMAAAGSGNYRNRPTWDPRTQRAASNEFAILTNSSFVPVAGVYSLGLGGRNGLQQIPDAVYQRVAYVIHPHDEGVIDPGAGLVDMIGAAGRNRTFIAVTSRRILVVLPSTEIASCSR